MTKIDVLVFLVSIIFPNVRSSDDNLQASFSDDFSCCTWMSGSQGTLKVTCPGVNDEPSISCVRNLLANFTGEPSIQPLDVHFTDCYISLFEDNFFEPYDVAGLEFRRCGLQEVPVGVFSSVCHQITVGLGFAENSIESISASNFQGCFRVMQLDLTYNSIGNIDADDFQYMTQLQSLYLEGNSIQRIDGFKSLANLRQLFINLNDVQYISLNAFEELEMVQILNLADNSITTLEDNVFESLKSLSTLDLKNNHFDCVCSLKWLQDWIIQIGLATDTKCETPVYCDMVSFEFCATTTTPMITTQSTTKLTSTTRATSTSSSTVTTTTVPTSTTTTVPTTTSPTTTPTTKPTTISTTEPTTAILTTELTTILTTKPTTTILTTEPTTTILTTEPTTTILTTEPTTATTSTTPATTSQATTELVTSSTPETSTVSTTIMPTTIPTTTPTSVSTATSTMTTSTETSTSTKMTSAFTTTSLQSSTASSNGGNGGSDIVVENFTLSDNLTLTWVSTESKVIIMYSPVTEGCSPALIDGLFLRLADGVHAVILENETFYTIRDYDDNFSPYLVCIVSAQLNHTMANFICGRNCLNTTAPPPIINPTTMPSQSVVSLAIAIGLICAVVLVGLIIIIWLCCLLRLSKKKDRTLEIEEPALAVDMAARPLPARPDPTNAERISCLNPLYNGPPDHRMTPSYLYLETTNAEDRSLSGGLSASDTYEKIRQTPSQKYENISDLISVDSNDSQS